MDINRAYKDIKVQPIDLIQSNNLPFELGNVLKYVLRNKDSKEEDILKAIHYCELFLNRAGRKVTYEEFIRENQLSGHQMNVVTALKAYSRTRDVGVVELLHTVLGLMLKDLPEE